jgi:hypothetical protein
MPDFPSLDMAVESADLHDGKMEKIKTKKKINET